MERSELDELHYITPIDNVASMLSIGIVSHKRAQALKHRSVAMSVIQDRRAGRKVPGGLPLHEYVNVYICARNPMLYKRHDSHLSLTVLRLSTDILDLPGVVIADGNASSDYTAFWPSPHGLGKLQRDLVFAEYWTDPNRIEYLRKARVKCAEVLVPNVVEPGFIVGAYVSCHESERTLTAISSHLAVTEDAHLFFRK